MNRRQFLASGALLGAGTRLRPELLAQSISTSSQRPFRAGFAERDITPELGMEKPGSYIKFYHQHFHDACKVRAAVFDDGDMRVGLVGIDALVSPAHLVESARKDIQERCGISQEAILVGASHSHSAGPLGMVQPGQYDHASDFVQRLAYEESSLTNASYLRHVQQQIVDAVCEANDSRVGARCGVGSGVEDKVAFNRRFRMKNGLTYTNPGQGNPDILEVAGPIDPEVGVIGSWDTHGRLLGCIVNYACHASQNPRGTSASWIYHLEQTIRGTMGRDVTVVFLQGACGDVTTKDNRSPYASRPGDETLRVVGGRVGAEAIKVLLSVEPGNLAPLDARSRILRVARRVPSAERVKRSYDLVKKGSEATGETQWIFAKEIVMLDALLAREPIVEVEVQAIQVGPAVFITNPAEFFVEFGLELKAKSSFPFTYPVELANGSVGYVPTEEAFGEHGGGYETRLTSYSNLEPTAGRQMVETGLELAGRLTPGPVPTPAKAPPFTGPWDKGSVPPELH